MLLYYIHYTESRPAAEVLPFDFWGGHIGYFGYELRHDTTRYNQYNHLLLSIYTCCSAMRYDVVNVILLYQ
jgi:hypothetical protein